MNQLSSIYNVASEYTRAIESASCFKKKYWKHINSNNLHNPKNLLILTLIRKREGVSEELYLSVIITANQ